MEDYIEIESNVKRIKTFTLGSDVSIDYLIIKNDGTVEIVIVDDNNVTCKVYDELKDYKVDDIIDLTDEFTLKLLDGTTKKVKHFSGGE